MVEQELEHTSAATQNETEVLRVLHQPRKMRLRCSTEVLQVLRLPRKGSRRPVLNRRRAPADLSGGAPRAAPATQNAEVLQVLHLPCKRSWHPQHSIIAGLPRTSLEVLHLLHLP